MRSFKYKPISILIGLAVAGSYQAFADSGVRDVSGVPYIIGGSTVPADT